MKNNTYHTEETFHEARKEVFDDTLANYDFGDEFVGNDSINKDGDIWSCKVYLESEERGDTIPVSFMVEFEENSTEVIYTSHDII